MSRDQQRITISEVAADWHELMILQHIMRPSIARASEQLDPRSAASRHTIRIVMLCPVVFVNMVTKYPTTPKMRRYTILWNTAAVKYNFFNHYDQHKHVCKRPTWYCLYLCQILTDFRNFFTVALAVKLPINRFVNIPANLHGLWTLTCCLS